MIKLRRVSREGQIQLRIIPPKIVKKRKNMGDVKLYGG
jgi:hypothetical protein